MNDYIFSAACCTARNTREPFELLDRKVINYYKISRDLELICSLIGCPCGINRESKKYDFFEHSKFGGKHLQFRRKYARCSTFLMNDTYCRFFHAGGTSINHRLWSSNLKQGRARPFQEHCQMFQCRTHKISKSLWRESWCSFTKSPRQEASPSDSGIW